MPVESRSHTPPPSATPWRPATRVGFRFAFAYFAIFVLMPRAVWDQLVPALAGALEVALPYRPNGSGDTTYNYLQLLASVSLATLAAAIWTLADRQRQAYPRLAEWLTVAIRYSLAITMIGYGQVKIFSGQFPQPSLETLMQSYGSASPMGLAWTFMGFSPGYQRFAGVLELIGALLLFSRRTTTLGALLCAAVMANVVMLNFCFDIPVKLLSSHLLIFALGLVALDAGRLVDVLIRDRPTEAKLHPPHFERRRLHIAGRVLKGLVIASMLVPNFYVGAKYYLETHGPDAPRSPYYGVYQIDELIEDGQPRPGLITDDERWRYLIFDRPKSLSVMQMDGSIERYEVEIDAEAGTMQLSESRDFHAPWSYAPPPEEPITYDWRVVASADRLELVGQLDGHQLELVARAQPLDFLLTSRGFHWINETPLNR